MEQECVVQRIETLEKDQAFIDLFEQRVKSTIKQFNLFNNNDKILVAVSGGKDSTVVIYLMKKLGYDVEAVTVDAHIGCYTQKNLENIRELCKSLNVKLHEISFRKVFGASLCYIRDALKEAGHDYKSCTVCGVLRRYLLNRKAKELGATKLVMGHNQDDEAQAFLMNLLKNRTYLSARTGPENGIIEDEKFVKRVKPLFFTSEEDVIKYSKMMQFPVKYGKCPCSVEGFRNHIKDALNDYEKINPNVKKNIVAYFLKMLPKLRQKFHTTEKPNSCELCAEPCADKMCRTCQLITTFRASQSNNLSIIQETPISGRNIEA